MMAQENKLVMQVHRPQQLLAQELNFENLIIHSKLYEFSKNVDDSGLSIKVGWRGEEHYFINGQPLTIDANQYLVINRHQQFNCQVHSKELVEGLCIYITPRHLWEAYHQHTGKDILEPVDVQSSQPFELLEKTYSFEENELGNYLNKLRHQICYPNQLGPAVDGFVHTELADLLVRTQLKIDQQISSIPSTKATTRKELYRRLSIARNYILEHFNQAIQLEDLAKEAALSKFHLLRTFKLVYGITPYQLVLKLRMNKAVELIQKGYSIEQIATDLGFSDRRTFTKAFKKAYQAPPSAFRTGTSNLIH